MEEAANLISSLQRTLSEVDAVVSNVNERSKRTILHIETAAQRLMQTITEHRHKLISKVCEITEAKLHALQVEKEIVQDNFRAVENVLRCAQNTNAVEDSEEWENALSRQMNNLEGVVFDFLEYDEDMKFHFLYRDEKLLAAICKFGDVFTVANDGHPKVASREAVELHVQAEMTEDSAEEEFDTDYVADSEPLLMEFQENLSSPGQTTAAATQMNFMGVVLTQVFEETVDVTQLKEDTNNCKELTKEDFITSKGETEGGIGDSKYNGNRENEIVQDMIRSDYSGPVEHRVSTTHKENEGSSHVHKETSNTAIEDLNNNNNNNSGIARQEHSSAT